MGLSTNSANNPLPLFDKVVDFSFKIPLDEATSLTLSIHAEKVFRNHWNVTIQASDSLNTKKIIELKSSIRGVPEVDIGFINPDYQRPDAKLYNLYDLLGNDHAISQKFRKQGDAIFCALKVKAGYLEITSETGISFTLDSSAR